MPATVIAELYRATPIENYDTAACRILTTDDTEILFYVSHVTIPMKGPIFQFEFENAIISMNNFKEEIKVVDKKGNEINYGAPDKDHQFYKLFEAIETVRNTRTIVCGPEASSAQLLCMNGVQESVRDIVTFPKTMIERNESERRWCVKGLDEAFLNCYQNNILPSEAKYLWAKIGNTIDLRNYHYFPSEDYVKK